MRSWNGLWRQLRELAWLASIASAPSIAGVGLAVALVLVS
jgi:hypothetical protein